MAPEITRITQEFLHNPERVEVSAQATTGENIDQKVCVFKAANRKTESKEKRQVLRDIIKGEYETLTNGIVFCNRKIDVDAVAKSLKKHGFDAAAIHGDLDQKIRTRTLDAFRNGELKLLVASDVAARGLDIPNVSHVFNFDVPIHSEDYVHRIGRTGRAGREGWAVMLCLSHEEKYLDKIEELVKKKIPRVAPPSATGDVSDDKSGGRGSKAKDRPAKETSEKPARKSREVSRKSTKKDQQAEPAEAVVEKPEPVADAEAPAPKQERRAPKRDNKRDQGRGDNRRDSGRDNNRGGGKPVVGLGDHVPAFIMQEFPVIKKSPQTVSDDDSDDSSGENSGDAA